MNSRSVPPSAHPVRHPIREDRPAPLAVISSESLFKGAQEIAIEHQGLIYRLRITRQGKLILNK